MSAYPWHQAILDQVAGNEFQSLLVVAAPGQGVDRFSQALTQRVMCQTQDACGQCPSCKWLTQDGHPDVYSMHPEGKAHAHKIDAIREVTQMASTTTHQGGRRVIQIFEAERMNIAGANGLLKFLEEPPAGTHFILSTTLPGRLPATILSRCRLVRLPSASEQGQWMDQIVPASPERDQAMRLSTAPDHLVQLVASPEELSARVAWLDKLQAGLAHRASLAELVEAGRALPLLQCLDDWYGLCLDEAKRSANDPQRLLRLVKFQSRLERERRPVLEQVTMNPSLVLRALGSLWLRVAPAPNLG